MMLCYPQLSTGAISQFPVSRNYRYRTLVNELQDDTSLRYADADATTILWTLAYTGLNTEERDTLDRFFNRVQGPLRTFLFLDPCGNLLRYSEDLTKSVWSVDGSLTVSVTDGVISITNGAQVAQSFQQRMALPPTHSYCGSVLVRCDQPTVVTPFLAGNDSERISSATAVANGWTAASVSGVPGSDGDEISFGLEVPAGVNIQVSGLQLEPQPSRSGYRRTGSRSGRFDQARFDQNSLTFRADGIDSYSTTVRVITPVRWS